MYQDRARRYYAAAVILFQDPSVDDCEVAIELLDKAVEIYPDFSEALTLRGDVWHYYLTKHYTDNYKLYLRSDAWDIKRKKVMERDNNQCACGSIAEVVHHKTYLNVGKEPLSDLIALCRKCHEVYHDRSGKLRRWQDANENQVSLPPDRPSILDDITDL